MEVTDNPDPESVLLHKKIARALEPDEIYSIMNSLAGVASLMASHLMDNHKPPDLPKRVCYAVIQAFAYCSGLRNIAHGSEDVILKHLPTPATKPDSWLTDEDFEERFAFVVKSYYEALKKEGFYEQEPS